jgi:hypothetical protein
MARLVWRKISPDINDKSFRDLRGSIQHGDHTSQLQCH